MKFVAEVELGNSEMTRPADVLHCITIAMVKQVESWEDFVAGQGGSLRDINGNTVGKWEVVED